MNMPENGRHFLFIRMMQTFPEPHSNLNGLVVH